MDILTIATTGGTVLVAKIIPRGLVKLAVYDDDSDVNAAFLDSDQAKELAHFILENVK